MYVYVGVYIYVYEARLAPPLAPLPTGIALPANPTC